ncbi:MAG: EamA family transporter, partial [Candidatus Binatia bacterium]
TTSLLCLATSLLVTGKISALNFNRKCLPYFVVAGFVASLGQLFTFMALNAGQVSVVAPLGNTTPLFIIAYSALFLRGEEKITMPVVLGAVLLVGGIAVITGR